MTSPPFIIAVAALFLASALAACTTVPPEARPVPHEWTAFRLNPELNPVLGSTHDQALRWTFKTAGGISSSPTVAGDTLYVASNGHRVYALALATGRPRWTYVAGDEVMSAPLVYRGTVIVGEGNNHADSTMFDPPHYLVLGDGTNALVGLDERTGRLRWKRRMPGSAMPTGAIVGDTYLEHDAAGMIFGYGATDGTYRFRTYVGSSAAMVAANRYHGDAVVTAGDYPNAVLAVDGRTGAVLWRTRFSETDGGFDDCPLASDGRTIYGTYNARPADSRFGFVGYTTPAIQHAYALDGRTGDVEWDVALTRGVLPINNSTAIPMLYDGTLYLGSAMKPVMFALDARTGATRWRRAVGGPVKGGVVARDGIVYFGDAKGFFWGLDAARGTIVRRKKLFDGFGVGSPIVVGSSIVDGTIHGYVVAMPLDSFRAAPPHP